VEQVQPEAVVQSSVTMFPVLVSLDNSDGALMPGMNGQVVMDILRRDNVLAVPSDAIRNARDAATVAPVLGVNPDSLKAAQAAARAARGFGPGGGGGGGGGGTASSTASGDTTRRRRFGAASSTQSAFGGQGGAQGTASSTGRRFGGGGAAGGAGAAGGSAAGGGAAGGAAGGGAGGGRTGGALFVFVKKGDTYSPRVVRVGVSDFDYTEILNGAQQGEQVALLGPAVLEAQREQLQARVRAGTGGGLQTTTPAAGGAAGGGVRGGGGGGRPPGT